MEVPSPRTAARGECVATDAGQAGIGRDSDEIPRIRLSGLRKTVGQVVAVDSVDLDVGGGGCLAGAGPSGSGMTTVLRMIAGFEEPPSGSVRLGGVDVTR